MIYCPDETDAAHDYGRLKEYYYGLSNNSVPFLYTDEAKAEVQKVSLAIAKLYAFLVKQEGLR